MPIYEYRCQTCGKMFEELVSGNSSASVPCPSCHSAKTEKLMSVLGGISMGSSKGASCGAADSCGAAGSSCCSGGSCPMAQ